MLYLLMIIGEATKQLTLFEQQSPWVDDFRDRLIWGDNKGVRAALMRSFKGKVDWIDIGFAA